MVQLRERMSRHSAIWSCLVLLVLLGCGGSGEDAAVRADGGPKSRTKLFREIFWEHPEMDEEADRQVAASFLELWVKHKPVFKNRFLGVQTLQNPLDAWIIQELISEIQPDFIIEAGTWHGGSAALWALFLENVNPAGRVITIDIEDNRDPRAVDLAIARRRVDFLLGSSTDPEIVAEVERRVRGKKVLVLLDSVHSKEHVAAELQAYAPMVPVGSYVIVQDTLVGPIDAIDEFLAADDRFVADRERERFLLTNTVRGYLRRVR